jgi:membrane fusion protein, copper/silver efflux system
MIFSTINESTKGGTLRRVFLGVAILAAFGLGFVLRGGGGSAPDDSLHEHQADSGKTIWTCSMHPQIKLPKAGQCPLCFMDLIPLESGDEEDLGPRVLVLTETAVALAEIQTTRVESRQMDSQVPLTGKVDFDETLYRVISARVPGRLDTLFVDYTGVRVAKGQRLASLYSPDLFAAQWELLNAVKAESEYKDSSNNFMRETAAATVASAKERIRLWGLSDAQIERIISRGKALDHLDIISPLSGVVVHKAAMEGLYVKTGTSIYTVADLSRVWVTLNAYESDIALLQTGQTLDFTVKALPGREFSGDIIFIDPILDSKTRTIQIRVEVDNKDGALKPGMFVNAVANGLVTSSSGNGNPLVIPATAPMITGERAVVYVRLPNHEKPTFDGRVVQLGSRVGDHYVVKSGLQEGDMVVTKGNFKIDSALQIQAKPSMMNPGDEVIEEEPEKDLPLLDIPEGFRNQLDGVLEGYMALQRALARDDDPAAKTAAEAALKALKQVDMGLLAEEAHLVWMKDGQKLGRELSALVQAPDIESRRKVLRPASEILWSVLKRFGHTQNTPVRLFHCPMAIDEDGANWMQMTNETANPYYGASMLRCGSQVDSLQVRPSDEGR